MNYEKTKIALYYRLLGMGYYVACKAFTFAQEYHKGVRKDSSPEFSHQVWIANFAITLPIPKEDMEILLAAIFLHDVCEDYDVTFEEIERQFGKRVREIVQNLSKVYRGQKIEESVYFERISNCALSAIAKGCDRLHNLSSMVGAFTKEKQISYIKESTDWHLPVLKTARRKFPQYELAFENIKLNLTSRISLIEIIHQNM